MRFSKMLIPTQKEIPAEATVKSHQLMIRSGMMRKVAAGVYSFLPLGYRVIAKVTRIVREEMTRVGGQEVILPTLHPSELWKKSKRWHHYGPELFRLKDRKDGDFCLAPTHEEVVTDLVKGTINSYKQLPATLFQVQTKFRDEIRPRFGVMRGREFIMKDAYTFDIDKASSLKSYQAIFKAYENIFKRCGLKFKAVEASTGSIGGNHSHEFQVLAETGEDLIASCKSCDYAANVELAAIFNEKSKVDNEKVGERKEVHTPSQKTCEAVALLMKTPLKRTVKSVLFMVEGNKPVMALCRGDHEVSEAKLIKALGVNDIRLMTEEEAFKLVGPSGFLGPVGLKKEVEVISDITLENSGSLIVGANKKGYHLDNVVYGRDFKSKSADIRKAVDKDICQKCGTKKFEFHRGIEVGHIFYLGTKYSKSLQATVANEKGQEVPLEMGCYGIGIARTVAAAIEQNYHSSGVKWPISIAPFQVALVSLGEDASLTAYCDKLYAELVKKGIEVLYDDRKERAGVKFSDQDLIGCPIRLTVGNRSLKKKMVEMKVESEVDGKAKEIAFDDCVAKVAETIGSFSKSD